MTDKRPFFILANLYDARGGQTSTLDALLKRGVDAFLLVNAKVDYVFRDLRPFFLGIVDGYERSARQEDSQKKGLQSVEKALERLDAATATAEEGAAIPVVLPRLSGSMIDRQVINGLRALVTKRGHRCMVFLGDLVTFRAASVDTEYSALSKELIPEVWVVEKVGGDDPTFEWLSGGDPRLVRALERVRSTVPDGPDGLRWAAHLVTAEIMSFNNAEGLEYRLRDLLGMAPPDPARAAPLEESLRLAALYAALGDLLPGPFAPNDPRAPRGWYERHQAAVWRPFNLLPDAMQDLVAGGLLGFEPDGRGGTLYRLRSPLMAYAVARQLRPIYWQPGSPPIQEALDIFHRQMPDERPTSLDWYLDALRYKAMGGPDGENDHWTVAALSGNSGEPPKIDGRWWEHLGTLMEREKGDNGNVGRE